MEWTLPVGSLFLRLERFAPDTVETGVGFFINIALCIAETPHFLCRCYMHQIGSANESIIAQIECFLQFLKLRCVVVDVCFRLLPCPLCRLKNLLTVFIRTH